MVGYNRSPEITRSLEKEAGLIPSFSLDEMVSLLEAPKIVWVMVPSGDTTEKMLETVMGVLVPGDIVVDGGNSNFNDTMRRSKKFEEKKIHFIDAGVSGGIWGLSEGYSLMIGGEENIVDYLAPIFSSLAPGKNSGWGRVGPIGSGHFVKMVHNGIEYGMMEAYAEGFELMKAHSDFGLDLHQISQIWRSGSVVRSWLLDLIGNALEQDPDLKDIKGWVADSGEGRWTSIEAINHDVPAPVITLALYHRFYSRQDDGYAGKLLAAMRNQFGGHAVVKNE